MVAIGLALWMALIFWTIFRGDDRFDLQAASLFVRTILALAAPVISRATVEPIPTPFTGRYDGTDAYSAGNPGDYIWFGQKYKPLGCVAKERRLTNTATSRNFKRDLVFYPHVSNQ
jgi:hypothetical protein